jgi:hypothetical protein
LKTYKHIDLQRENTLRHLEARGVDIQLLLSRNPNATNRELHDLLAGILQLRDTVKFK